MILSLLNNNIITKRIETVLNFHFLNEIFRNQFTHSLLIFKRSSVGLDIFLQRHEIRKHIFCWGSPDEKDISWQNSWTNVLQTACSKTI